MKEEKLQEAKRLYESANADQKYVLESLFPELAGSEDEQIRKELTKHLKEGVEGYMPAGDSSDYRRWLDWLEKQGKSSDQIHYWTEEEIEPIISDYLRGTEHYGGMIGRLRCLKPKSLEKQGESYTKKDVADLNEFVKEYSFNIPSDIYNFLPKKKQSTWINEIESAVRAGVQWLEKQGEQKSSDEVLKIRQEVYQSGYNDGYKHGCEDTKKQDEQKPAVEMKTPEESLGIDSNIYNEIVDECIYGEQKYWSEEDEKRLSDAIFFVREYQIPTRDKRLLNAAKEAEEWLKSLKERVGG